MNFSLNAMVAVVNGKLGVGNTTAAGDDLRFSSFSINTRTLQAGDVYIAIKGQVFDGHDFVAEAVAAGASAVIVQREVATTVPSIIVNDTHWALAQLATARRLQSQALIVGVTGSNGKTTVKELLAAILSVNAPVLYTQGNLNNDIGVPLTLLKLHDEHRYAVIEMGANHAGEIAYTSTCAKADVVLINNVGDAHLEGFGSLEGVAHAKGEIVATLKEEGIAILNRDDQFYAYWKTLAGARKNLSFGLSAAADFSADAISTEVDDHQLKSQFELITPLGNVPISLNLAGTHNVLNAVAASAAAVALGIDLEQIQQGLASLQPVKGRLQPVIGRLGNILIDDTYNANPSSLKVALDVLKGCHGEPWLALGAFGELGPDSVSLHANMAADIKSRGVTRLFATGVDAKATVEAFGVGASYFAEQVDLIKQLNQELTPNITLLIKGSRAQHMENVVAALTNTTGKPAC
ncbi:MAG: UDP-N-acetylmuramoyl-tripeptide--D-alanyl-D-alanine ligase [Methylococcaceae bacterium]|nr:UDP-N-acetylmuramoyl-tripeptide--D-alanyl-D-alanine ligase [Methylococcaceae bacterium]